jgi:hypothetical protein
MVSQFKPVSPATERFPVSSPRLPGPTRLSAPKANAPFLPITAGIVKPNIALTTTSGIILDRQLQTEQVFPAKTALPRPRKSLMALTAIGAGAAALLIPGAALAGTGLIASTVSLFAGLGPVGWAGAAIGGYLTIKLAIAQYRQLQPANYQSKNMKLNTNNTTPGKLLKYLVLPAWVFTVGVGSIFSYLPAAEAFLNWAPDRLYHIAFALLAAKPLITMASYTIRDIKQKIEYSGLRLGGLCLGTAAGIGIAVGIGSGLVGTVAGLGTIGVLWAISKLSGKKVGLQLAKARGITRYLPRHRLIGEIATDLLAPAAWLAQVTFTTLLSEAYSTQLLGLVHNFFANIPATFGSLSGIAALGEYGLFFAAGTALFRYTYSWVKEKISKFPDELPPRLKSARNWGLYGAAVGAAIYLAGPAMVVANLFIFVVTFAFALNAMHSLRSQETGLHQASKKQPVFDKESLWDAVRSAKGASRTVWRPSVGMDDSLISAYLMMVLSEGANCVIKGVDGTTKTAGPNGYQRSQEMIEQLIKKDALVIQKIIQDGDAALEAATTRQEAINAVADTYDKLADLMIKDDSPLNGGHPLAWGDLRARSGLSYLKDSTFSKGEALPEELRRQGGLPWKGTVGHVDFESLQIGGQRISRADVNTIWADLVAAGLIDVAGRIQSDYDGSLDGVAFTLPLTADERAAVNKILDDAIRSDQDLRAHGGHIHFAAVICRAKAERLRNQRLTRETLKSLKEDLGGKLEGAFRRAAPFVDSHPRCFWTTFWTPGMPDPLNVKQSGVDEFEQMMADFVGVFDAVVMTADGRIHDWPIPLKVVKDFKDSEAPGGDYKHVQARKSRIALGEDLRMGWYDREEHDIGDSLTTIAYIDNSAHYNKYQRLHAAGMISDADFLALYPTAEVPAPPTLKNEPQMDEDGVFEDKEFYDVVYKNGARLRVFADGSQKAIGRLPDDAPALLMLPGTNRHGHVAAELQRGRDAAVFGTTPLDPCIRQALAEGKVPHPFGGNFTDNKYLMPRWHFFYPTEYVSVSDADQTDIVVTNLRLFHTRKNPHLRVMFTRPRLEKLPFSPDMLEEPQDSLLEVGIATVAMTLKVKMKPENGQQKQLYIPLNMNKEDPRTFGGEIWRYIDQDRQVEIDADRMVLKIPYAKSARFDPAFRAAQQTGLMFGGKYNTRESIEEVPIPLEMRDFVDKIAETEDEATGEKKKVCRINPERYSEVGGPRPVTDYFFVRRDKKTKLVTNKGTVDREGRVTGGQRELALSVDVADMLIYGKIALLHHTEAEYLDIVGYPKEKLPWTDQAGYVHAKMSESEYKQLKQWVPAWEGKHTYGYENGELVMFVKHFQLLCDHVYDQITYRRFMPDDFRNYFDPSEVEFSSEKAAS